MSLRTWWNANSPVMPAVLHAQRAQASDTASGERRYTVTFHVNGEDVRTYWEGTSRQQVAAEVAHFLMNPANDEEDMPTSWRSIEWNYQGRVGVFAFRADFITGFNVTGGSNDED